MIFKQIDENKYELPEFSSGDIKIYITKEGFVYENYEQKYSPRESWGYRTYLSGSYYWVHELIGHAFLPYSPLPYIYHINGNVYDNRVENLAYRDEPDYIVKICAACGEEFKIYSGNPRNRKRCKRCIESGKYPPKEQKAPKVKPIAPTIIVPKNDTVIENNTNIKIRPITQMFPTSELLIQELIKLKNSYGQVFNDFAINYWMIGDIPAATREKVLDRDEHKCQICGNTHNLHLHHMIPRKQGGDHSDGNLITLCPSCHRAIETGDLDHALRKCSANLKKYYYFTDDIRDKAVEIASELNNIYDMIDKNAENQELLIKLDNVIRVVEHTIPN